MRRLYFISEFSFSTNTNTTANDRSYHLNHYRNNEWTIHACYQSRASENLMTTTTKNTNTNSTIISLGLFVIQRKWFCTHSSGTKSFYSSEKCPFILNRYAYWIRFTFAFCLLRESMVQLCGVCDGARYTVRPMYEWPIRAMPELCPHAWAWAFTSTQLSDVRYLMSVHVFIFSFNFLDKLWWRCAAAKHILPKTSILFVRPFVFLALHPCWIVRQHHPIRITDRAFMHTLYLSSC